MENNCDNCDKHIHHGTADADADADADAEKNIIHYLLPHLTHQGSSDSEAGDGKLTKNISQVKDE